MIINFPSCNHSKSRYPKKLFPTLLLFTAILGNLTTSLTAQNILSSHRLKSEHIQGYLPPLSYADVLYPNLVSYSQTMVQQESKINWAAFTITSAALTGIYTSFFIYEQSRRWDTPKLPFYFNSKIEAKGIDKISHFYAAKTQASIISNLYEFSNINHKISIWLGTGIALSVQTLIEIKDGKISGGGFDIYDQIANTLGAGWFYAREHSRFLKRFNIRWLYYPSEEKKLLPPGAQFNEDYNGHTFWLSVQVWDLLPQKIQPYWPRFIVPVAGISLDDWSVENNQNGNLSYHLSLNPDFRYILPQESQWGQTLADFLNGFYIPAPAVEVYPDFGFKLIFYGQN